MYTTTETPFNLGIDRYVLQFEGYFVPLSSGFHTFFAAYDDNVRVYLTRNGKDPENKEEIISKNGASGYRVFDKYPEQTSEAIDLEMGVPSYF